MSKSLKKHQPPKGTRPISDFFAKRSSLTPQSSLSTLDSTPSAPQEEVAGSKQRVPTSSNNSPSSRIFVAGNSPRKLVSRNASLIKPEATTTTTTTHRRRTPEPLPDSTQTSNRAPPVKSRKNKFDSDSEQEQPDSVIYVAKSSKGPGVSLSTPLSREPPLTSKENLLFNPSEARPKKKQRMSPETETIDNEDRSSLPPTSATDDWEIDSTFDLKDTQNSTKRDTDGKSSETETTKNDGDSASVPMEVDEPQVITEALNPTSKAARIIADIKAKAYANAQSQLQKPPVLEVRDSLSDSDDDDDKMISPSAFAAKVPPKKESQGVPTKPKLSIPSAGSSITKSSPSPATPAEESIARNRPRRAVKQPSPVNKEPSPITAAPVKTKPKKKPNPLDALLKEKELAEKKGHGEEAYRRAEAAISKMASRLQNDDFTDLSYLDEDDKDTRSNPGSARDHGSDSEGTGEVVRKRLFGDERATEIRNLIEGDKTRLKDEKAQEKIPGIPFWLVSENDVSMDVDGPSKLVCSPPDGVTNPAFSLLTSAVDRKDWNQANIILTSGALCLGKADELSLAIPYLLDLALSCENFLVFSATLQALKGAWEKAPTFELGWNCAARWLALLGASPTVFTSMGWTASVPPNAKTEGQIRENHLFRMIQIILSAARLQRIPQRDVPNFIMAMVFIANDPTTSLDIYRQLMVLTSVLCDVIAPRETISVEIETELCVQVLRYAAPLNPVNQAAVVTFLSSGKGRMLRIARWVAFGLIKGEASISSAVYSAVPDLALILEEFFDPARDEDDPRIGKFETTGGTDYVDFAFSIRGLAVVVTDVHEYIIKERNAGLQGQQAPLSLLIKALDSLHSAIADGRAAHITRSRAKAALKLLSHRIHYQRAAASKEVGRLDSYWTKGKKK